MFVVGCVGADVVLCICVHGLGVPVGVILGAGGFAWEGVGVWCGLGISVGMLLGTGGLVCAGAVIMCASGCGKIIVVLDVVGTGVYVRLTDDVRCLCQKKILINAVSINLYLCQSMEVIVLLFVYIM